MFQTKKKQEKFKKKYQYHNEKKKKLKYLLNNIPIYSIYISLTKKQDMRNTITNFKEKVVFAIITTKNPVN